MEVQVEGKTFILELKHGFVFVEELSRNGSWWIKFPVELFGWLSDSLRHFTSLVELRHSKKVGFLLWEINSGCNIKGWFLDLSVSFRNSKFSILVPAESSFNPWKRFIDSLIHMGGGIQDKCLVHLQNRSDDFEAIELMVIGNREFGNFEKRVFKEGVDHVFEMECTNFGHPPLQNSVASFCQQSSFKVGVDELLESECLGFPSSLLVSIEPCTISSNEIPLDGSSCVEQSCAEGCNEFPLVGSSCVVQDCSECSEVSGVGVSLGALVRANVVGEVEDCVPSSQLGSVNTGMTDYLESVQDVEVQGPRRASGSDSSEHLVPTVELVSSFPFVHNPRKKRSNPAKIAIISFPIDVSLKDNVVLLKESSEVIDAHVCVGKPFAKPCMATRLSPRCSTSSCVSPWDRLPKGVKNHPISKYSEYTSQDVDRKWVLEALELDVNASDEDIFKRMYQFQKVGKIKIKRKIIRILESLHNDGIRWGVSRP